STGSFGSCVQAHPGAICRFAMAHAPPATTASSGGEKAGVWDRIMNSLAAAHDAAREFLDDELNVLERLEGRIARAVKQLVQTKAMKQMLRQTSREREQPRTITARSTSSDES